QSLNWINRFYLIGFNSTWADVITVSPGRDPHEIISELNRLAKVAPADSGCRVQLWQGFEQLIRWKITAGSFVEVFQTSPDDRSARDLTRFRNIFRSKFLKMNGFLLHSPEFKPNGFACEASQLDYALSFLMPTLPLQPSATANISQVIPLQYQSALVHVQHSSHCTQPIKIHFPVDAYTQTIQISASGHGKTLHVFDPNGKEVEGFSLVQDRFSGWDVVEIRRGTAVEAASTTYSSTSDVHFRL
ncbi:hypothetical protein OSTOST_04248, partial [Ostertagia ostertagi]